MRKFTIVAALAMAVAAFALPSTASAKWTHNHVEIPQGNNPQIHGTGQALFVSEAAGQINCEEVTATAQLTGGQTTATIDAFDALNPETKCKTGGILAGCKVTSVQSLTLKWLAHITTGKAPEPTPKTQVQVTGVHITNKLHGFLCPQHITLQGDGAKISGEETGVTDGHTTINGLKIGGTLNAVPGGVVTISGTIAATPSSSHTYGWVNQHP